MTNLPEKIENVQNLIKRYQPKVLTSPFEFEKIHAKQRFSTNESTRFEVRSTP